MFIFLNVEKHNNYTINHIEYYKKGHLLFEWKDTIESSYKFTREIGKSKIYYENNELILYKLIKKTKGISKKKLPKNNNIETKFITMDLETILIDNKHIPYLLSWYDGRITRSYFIKDIQDNLENNILEMIKKAMSDICIRKYKNYRIYSHNFSKFDGYFMLKHLSKLGYCDPKIYKGKFISIKFRANNTKYNLTFKDSYLLLSSSLKALGKTFNIESPKGIFPYLFTDINYEGKIPDFKYFSNISLEEYKNYIKQFIFLIISCGNCYRYLNIIPFFQGNCFKQSNLINMGEVLN